MKNKYLLTSLALATGLALASAAWAQAPAGSTGQCKDGTYTQAQGKRGACRGHDGIKEWYADSKSATKTEPKEAKSTEKATTAAAAPAGAMPAGSTGQCKDGTYTQAESKRGACRGHGGVKDWYASGKKSESKAAAAPAAAPAPVPAAPAAPAPKSTTAASTQKGSEGMRAQAAPGGGAGKVWVNTSSKVYHCSGDEWYGKTKEGDYMTEAQAKASGARPARGKTCS
jgi:hypothetical protein